MKYILALTLLSLSVLNGCTTPPTQMEAESGGQIIPKPTGDYAEILNAWTRDDSGYQSLAASFKVNATLLSREVAEHQVFLDSQKYNWTPQQYNEARQKVLSDLQGTTTILVSLYTEKDEDNNLDKTGTVWNVFLDVRGKRIIPQQVKRIYENRVVLLTKYPYLDVWSRNYYVKFPIPTDDAASGGAELNISGPVGKTRLKFSR